MKPKEKEVASGPVRKLGKIGKRQELGQGILGDPAHCSNNSEVTYSPV
jgi:hypothetical protein